MTDISSKFVLRIYILSTKVDATFLGLPHTKFRKVKIFSQKKDIHVLENSSQMILSSVC